MTAYKRMDRDAVAAQTRLWRESGLRVVFTNGCFDLLHVGHVRYLAAARAEGDRLVVGLNSDASVRTIKGPLRPIVPEDQRAEVLSALECVDRVTLFDEPDPLNLILALRPDVLAKGADWAEKDIIGAPEVHGWGGRVARIRVVEGASTTGMIQRIQERYGGSS
ncbi:MAG: D-glycero-beta-D-manno-heptose 1-phosphate adenylyltransferase [Desulfococcaceae bacterium]